MNFLLLALAASADAFVIPEERVLTAPLQTAGWRDHLPYFFKSPVDSETLQSLINIEDLTQSAWDLYHIAKKSKKEYGHPTRVIGSKGHKATIDYILGELAKHPEYYDVSVQEFPALYGKIKSFNLTFPNGTEVVDASAMKLSPPVEPFSGHVVEIPGTGCRDHDYQGIHGKKKIALVSRGECAFGDKAALAGKHGFKGLILANNVPGEKLSATLGEPTNTTIGAIGVSYEAGKEIARQAKKHDFKMRFVIDSKVDKILTKNIIADTKHGDPENIVALGAHSDSVEDGPGINDDGSGTISLLHVAKHLTKYKIKNKVRFAWWSAEEEGLLGSTYYVSQLTPEENSKIRLFMDYDMMASPNYEYEVYDANNIDNPPGSGDLKELYIDYYVSHGLNYTLIPFDGRSDYVAFIENGIPGGGIAAGAEQNNVFNGDVLDKCYHMLCDDVSNLAMDAFLVNTRLIAHSVATYAKSMENFPKRSIVPMFNGENYEIVDTLSQPKMKFRGDSLAF